MWQSEVVPQLVADTDGRLQVLTLFKALRRRHPGRFQPRQADRGQERRGDRDSLIPCSGPLRSGPVVGFRRNG